MGTLTISTDGKKVEPNLPPTDNTGKVAPMTPVQAPAPSWKDVVELPRVEVTASHVSELKFPQDLMKDHISDWIAFYFVDLITKDGAKEAAAPTAGAAKVPDTSTSKQSQNSPVNSTNTTPVKLVTEQGAIGATKIGDVIAGLAGAVGADDTEAFVKKFTSIVSEEIALLGTATTYSDTGDIINLMMPSGIEFNDGAGWQAVNSTPTGWGLLAGVVLGDQSGSELARFEIAKIATSILMKDGEGTVESIKKKTLNPYTSQAFEAMARRQFRFNWTLTPKNGGELDAIHSIIKMFRFHMHPRFESGTAFLTYPSQVDIEFKSGSGLNSWLPKITRCVIKDFSVNYTPNNQWTTVDAADPGAPYQYQVSVSIEEVVPLTKEDIRKGF